MSQDPSVDAAMRILLDSGEARKSVSDAIAAVGEWDFERATERLSEAQAHLRTAHATHTDIIQAEAGGSAVSFPALFSHAQDTMMTTDGEIRLVRRLLGVFRSVDERLDALSIRLDEVAADRSGATDRTEVVR